MDQKILALVALVLLVPSLAGLPQVTGKCRVEVVFDPETGQLTGTCLQNTCTGTCELKVTPGPGGTLGWKCPCE